MNKGYPDEWDDPLPEELNAKPLRLGAPVTQPKLLLRHLAGEERIVEVEEATEDGALHVRWPGGAGCYVIHVFRTVQNRGYALLYRTAKSRIPLTWQAADPEVARNLWRKMTGRTEAKKWEGPWRKKNR